MFVCSWNLQAKWEDQPQKPCWYSQMCLSWPGRFKLARKLDGASWNRLKISWNRLKISWNRLKISWNRSRKNWSKTGFSLLGTCQTHSLTKIFFPWQKYSENLRRSCNIFSGGNILRTCTAEVEQSGSRFTALFFWKRIYLWQYLSISCAFAIYGSYITAKMGLLVPPADF